MACVASTINSCRISSSPENTNMKPMHLAIGLGALTFLSQQAAAFTIQYRVVERIGNVDYVLPDANEIWVRPGTSHRYRVQFQVTPENDDARAGFFAWNVGTIVATGGINTRTGAPPNPFPRGRVAPFGGA